MKSKIFRQYINSLRLPTADLPKYGLIGVSAKLATPSEWTVDKLLDIRGATVAMTNARSISLIMDPSRYVNRDALVATLVTKLPSIIPESLNLYHAATSEVTTDIASFSYQEMLNESIYYDYARVLSTTGRSLPKNTPNWKEAVAILQSANAGLNPAVYVCLLGRFSRPVRAYRIDGGAAFRDFVHLGIDTYFTAKMYSPTALNSKRIEDRLMDCASSLPSSVRVTLKRTAGTIPTPKAVVAPDTSRAAVYDPPAQAEISPAKADILPKFQRAKNTAVKSSQNRVSKRSAIESFIRTQEQVLDTMRKFEKMFTLGK